jgi:hypothetical protein
MEQQLAAKNRMMMFGLMKRIDKTAWVSNIGAVFDSGA